MTDDEALLEMDRLYKKLYSPPLATTFADVDRFGNRQAMMIRLAGLIQTFPQVGKNWLGYARLVHKLEDKQVKDWALVYATHPKLDSGVKTQ